jgi:hypothetical protein
MCVSGWEFVSTFWQLVGEGVVKDVVTIWSNARNPYSPELRGADQGWECVENHDAHCTRSPRGLLMSTLPSTK